MIPSGIRRTPGPLILDDARSRSQPWPTTPNGRALGVRWFTCGSRTCLNPYRRRRRLRYLVQAADCLAEAIAGRMARGMRSSRHPGERGQHPISVRSIWREAGPISCYARPPDAEDGACQAPRRERNGCATYVNPKHDTKPERFRRRWPRSANALLGRSGTRRKLGGARATRVAAAWEYDMLTVDDLKRAVRWVGCGVACLGVICAFQRPFRQFNG